MTNGTFCGKLLEKDAAGSVLFRNRKNGGEPWTEGQSMTKN